MRQVVLNSRPGEQAASLSRLLEAAGFHVEEAPAIAVVPAWSDIELARVKHQLRSNYYDWVVLASQNAGREVLDALTGARGEIGAPRVVTGSATSRKLGLATDLALDRFSAEAALQRMRPLVHSGEHVLVPRAAEGRDELIEGLRALGVVVDAPVAYRTALVPNAGERLRHAGIDVLTLCSPSSVASIVGIIGPRLPEGRLVVCLGQTTAGAAESLGLRVDAVARDTRMESMVEAIRSLLPREVSV